jgi:RNA-directed DNA polymerase
VEIQATQASEDRTRTWLNAIRQRSPGMFAHWTLRYTT